MSFLILQLLIETIKKVKILDSINAWELEWKVLTRERERVVTLAFYKSILIVLLIYIKQKTEKYDILNFNFIFSSIKNIRKLIKFL